ncbi:MAG: HpcH/HpaI aldolase family protein, partial [Elusimicrobiota bacterium]
VGFIGIDLEHSTISLEQSQSIIATAQAAGLVCYPRVSSHNYEQIRRLLDSGADGLIVPMVDTSAQVDQLINSIKYPPIGKRSYGVARAHSYGQKFEKYTKTWNERSVFIVQIESITAVKNIESILMNPSVDGVMVGPYDMSGSLGIPGQLDHPEVTKACAQVIDACKKHNKSCGTQIVDPDSENTSKALKQGYTFVVLASDVFILWKWAEKIQGLVRPHLSSSH